MLTPDGRISRYLYGVRSARSTCGWRWSRRRPGKVGGIVDRVLLTCFRYDPARARYGSYVRGVMRGGSALVLLLFVAGMVALLRRDRARGARGGDA